MDQIQNPLHTGSTMCFGAGLNAQHSLSLAIFGRCCKKLLLIWLLLPGARVLAQSPADLEFFEKQVRPLLVASCTECHGDEKQSNDLRLDSREAILKGGERGPAIVPGKPDTSVLIQAVRQSE